MRPPRRGRANRRHRPAGAAPGAELRRGLRQAAPAARLAAAVAAAWGLWRGGAALLSWCGQRLQEAPMFALAQRRCEGARRVSEEDIAAMAQAPLGRSVWAIDLEATARALRQHPWIKRVQVRRVLPDTLHIAVEEHQPALWVALGGLMLADEEGVLFRAFSPQDAAADGLDLPILTGLDRAEARRDPRAVAPKVLQALAVVAQVARQADRLGRLEEVHWDPQLGWSVTTAVATAAGYAPPVTTHLGDDLAGGLASAAACVQLLLTRAQHASIIWADGRQHPHRVLVRLARRPAAPSAREASWQTNPSSSPASTSAPPRSAPSSGR